MTLSLVTFIQQSEDCPLLSIECSRDGNKIKSCRGSIQFRRWKEAFRAHSSEPRSRVLRQQKQQSYDVVPRSEISHDRIGWIEGRQLSRTPIRDAWVFNHFAPL